MNKKVNVVVFLLIIYLISIFNLFNKNIDFSMNENRYLQKFPEFKIDEFLSGKFSDKFELWIQDQFIFRDKFIMAKALSSIYTFKLENNNVYFGSDDFLVNKFILNDESTLKNNMEILNKIKHKIILIPSSSEKNKDKINKFSFNTNQLELINKYVSNDNYISVYDELLGEDYFKMDHHINIDGAYKVYKKYVESLSYVPNEYTKEKLSNDFKGTTYSKSGLFYYGGEALYTFKELNDLNVRVSYDSEIKDSLFNEDKLLTKDKYAYFLDGNHGLVEIDNLDLDSQNNLLVLNDSFGHMVVPMLVSHFDKIVVVDMRYFKGSVSKLVEENKVNNVLVLYGMENFVSDKSLRFLK